MDRPTSGGSYRRDPQTGALTRVTTPEAEAIAAEGAAVLASPAAAEPVSDTPVIATTGDASTKKRTPK